MSIYANIFAKYSGSLNICTVIESDNIVFMNLAVRSPQVAPTCRPLHLLAIEPFPKYVVFKQYSSLLLISASSHAFDPSSQLT